MMIVAPNSLVRQEEGAQREEEEAGGRRRVDSIGTRTLPQAQLSQGCRMRGTVEKMDGGVGPHSTGREEQDWD